jgi:hypothetical protein
VDDSSEHELGFSPFNILSIFSIILWIWKQVLPDTIGVIFLSFFGAFKVAKKRHKGVVMLWQVVIRVIWRANK